MNEPVPFDVLLYMCEYMCDLLVRSCTVTVPGVKEKGNESFPSL